MFCINGNHFLLSIIHGISVVCVLVLGMQPPLPTAAVRELVCSCLHRDPVAADLRCSLFVAAVQSYKRDSALRPFPPRYLRGEIKDFEELVRHLKKINSVLLAFRNTNFYSFDSTVFLTAKGCGYFAKRERSGASGTWWWRSSSGSCALGSLL